MCCGVEAARVECHPLRGDSMTAKERARRPLYCTFCGHSDLEAECLIAFPAGYICDTCVDICAEIVAEHRAKKRATAAAQPEV